MMKKFNKSVEHEKLHWDKVFEEEIAKDTKLKFSSFWWANYYNEITKNINSFLTKNKLKTILEAGSGSGKATLLLDSKFKKTLLDISPNALKYALILSKKFKTKKPSIIEASVFSMPFKKFNFDLVWNIGVIEHYSDKDIKEIFNEMVRVCTKDGVVAIGIPNLYSGPIIKAAILRYKLFKFIPGYRLDTERFFKSTEIEKMLISSAKENGRKVEYIKTEYFGSPLIMEASTLIFKILNPIVSRLFPKNKFLMLVICKFRE